MICCAFWNDDSDVSVNAVFGWKCGMNFNQHPLSFFPQIADAKHVQFIVFLLTCPFVLNNSVNSDCNWKHFCSKAWVFSPDFALFPLCEKDEKTGGLEDKTNDHTEFVFDTLLDQNKTISAISHLQSFDVQRSCVSYTGTIPVYPGSKVGKHRNVHTHPASTFTCRSKFSLFSLSTSTVRETFLLLKVSEFSNNLLSEKKVQSRKKWKWKWK